MILKIMTLLIVILLGRLVFKKSYISKEDYFTMWIIVIALITGDIFNII